MQPGLCNATEETLNGLKMRGQPKLTTGALGADAQQLGALRLALDLARVRKKGAAKTRGNRASSPPVPLKFHDTVAGTFSITAVSEWSL